MDEAVIAARLVAEGWRPEKLVQAFATYALDAGHTEGT
jgi:hypothetical protein